MDSDCSAAPPRVRDQRSDSVKGKDLPEVGMDVPGCEMTLFYSSRGLYLDRSLKNKALLEARLLAALFE